jgi:hypothetical protein
VGTVDEALEYLKELERANEGDDVEAGAW